MSTLTDLFKAHDYDRMECHDHDGHCCPEGTCHDLDRSQNQHYAGVVAEWISGMDPRVVRDAIRRIQVGPIGPNSLEIAQRGGNITLTPDEAERMAMQALLALAAEAVKGAGQ